jgi:hypothetical protein
MTIAAHSGGAKDRPIGSPLEVLLAFLKLGVTCFGGPIAHIAFFREEFVVRRRWLDEQAYADLVGLVPARPRQQPGRIFDRPHSGRLSWRPRGMDRLYVAVLHRPRALRLRRGRAWWSNWHRAATWPQARCRGDRRSSRLGHGAHTMPRPGAGFHCRRGGAAHPVQHLVDRADRRYRVGRHRGVVALPGRATNIDGTYFSAGLAHRGARGTDGLLSPARRPSRPA